MQQRGRTPIRLVAFAALVSAAGSTAASIAIAVLIYSRTKSAIWLSVSFLLTFGVTGFLTPFVGLIADRIDRRRLLIATELASGAVYVVMAFVDSPVWIIVLGFIEALIQMPSASALRAAVPNLASRDDLPWANGLLDISFNIAKTAGPVMGGALAASVGAHAVFWINAASFAVSGAVLSTIRVPFSDTGIMEDERGILRGLRAIRRDRVLIGIALGWIFGYFAVDIVLVADLPFARLFGTGTVGYSIMNTTWSAAGLAGAWVSRWLTPRYHMVALVSGGASAFIGLAMGSLAPAFGILLLALVVTAFFDAITSVAGDSVIQIRTPDQVRGRVFAALQGAGWIANAVAFSIAGFLVEWLGPRGVYGIASIAGLIYGALLFFFLRGSNVNERDVKVMTA